MCNTQEVLTADREHYVLDNLKLVHHVLHKYIKPSPEDYDDCFQEGCLGLMTAAMRFKEGLGYKFSTFATRTILGTIKKRMTSFKPLVRYGANMLEIYPKIQQMKLEGLEDKQIMDALKLKPLRYFYILNIYNTASLNYETNEDGSISLADFIACEDNTPEQELVEKDFENSLESFINSIKNETHRAVYRDYVYSIYYRGEKVTQKTIGAKYGVSGAYVSAIVKKFNKIYKTKFEREGKIL